MGVGPLDLQTLNSKLGILFILTRNEVAWR